MENLIMVRRTNGRFAHKSPTIKLELNGNRFILSNKASENLGVKHNDGVMFGFNYKEKKAYLFKDDEPDAFILKTKSTNDSNLRFTSKDLMVHFVKCFQLDKVDNKYFFKVAEKPNNKGAYLVTY